MTCNLLGYKNTPRRFLKSRVHARDGEAASGHRLGLSGSRRELDAARQNDQTDARRSLSTITEPKPSARAPADAATPDDATTPADAATPADPATPADATRGTASNVSLDL